MKRFSIRSLMAVIVVAAIALAALRNADQRWAGMILLAVLTVEGNAILGAIFLKGRERAWWTGFALLAGTYLALSVSPLHSRVPTTRLMAFVHAKVIASHLTTFDISRFDRQTILYRAVSTDGTIRTKKVRDAAASATLTGSPKVLDGAESMAKPLDPEEVLASMTPVNHWQAALPGAANLKAFESIGHSLFALLAGLLGGMIAVCFYGRRERQRAASIHGR
jgi:hypothetical protein